MIRFYICPIVGTGHDTFGVDDDGVEGWIPDSQRAKIADYDEVLSYTAVLKTESDGKPSHSWCVVRVEADDWTAIEADSDLVEVGNGRLDAPLTNRQVVRAAAGLTQAEASGTVRDVLHVLTAKHGGSLRGID